MVKLMLFKCVCVPVPKLLGHFPVVRFELDPIFLQPFDLAVQNLREINFLTVLTQPFIILHLHERPVPLSLCPGIPRRPLTPPGRSRSGRGRGTDAVIVLVIVVTSVSLGSHAEFISQFSVFLLQIQVLALERVGLAGQVVDVGVADLEND